MLAFGAGIFTYKFGVPEVCRYLKGASKLIKSKISNLSHTCATHHTLASTCHMKVGPNEQLMNLFSELRRKRKARWCKLKYFVTIAVVILGIIGSRFGETRSMVAQQDFEDDRGVDSFSEIQMRKAKRNVMAALERYLKFLDGIHSTT